MKKMGESIVIERTARRISNVTVYNRDGEPLCQLPITGFTVVHGVNPGDGETSLRMHSFRVIVKDIHPDDQPTEEMGVIT